jgi:hypothetical protein
MLTVIPTTSYEILTHPYHPLAEENGFNQTGKLTSQTAFPKKIRPPVTDDGGYDDFNGLGLSFKSVTKSVSKAVKSVGKAATKVASKAALGGVTLITETGVLGKDAKKIGKKAETVAAGSIGGAVAGFLVNPTPVGLIVGGTAGAAKGFIEATKTRAPGDQFKAMYQGAGYGAGAGLTARAVTAGISSYQNAQIAKSAAMAEKVGYGAAQSTAIEAGTYAPGVSYGTITSAPGFFATSAKVAAGIGKYGVAPLLMAQMMGQKIPGAEGGMDTLPIMIPGGSTSTPLGPIEVSATGGSSGGGGMPGGSGGGGGEMLPGDESPSFVKSNLPYLAGGMLLLFFMVGNRRAK